MDDALLSQIWPVFSAEAREQLQEIASGCLEMEHGTARPELVDSIRRAAHSLKGSAGSLGFEDFERLAHALESSIDPAAGERAMPRARLDAVLEAVTALEAALASGDGKSPCTVPRLEELLRALGFAASAPAEGTAPAAAVPEPDLAPLEKHVQLLCSPGISQKALDDSAALAASTAASLARGGGAEAVSVCRAIEGLVRGAARPGSKRAARVAAELADHIVALRRALGASGSVTSLPAQPAQASSASAPDRSIRVSAQSIDSLARHVETFALAEADSDRRTLEIREVEALVKQALASCERSAALLRASDDAEVVAPLTEGLQRMRSAASGLAALHREGLREKNRYRLAVSSARAELRDLRMVPAALMLEPLRRTVREVASRMKKEIELRLVGVDVRLDRRLVDELHAPLLHLVRNAVDHGIEPPHERQAAGKRPAGLLEVRAEPAGSRIRVVVADDGRGLSLDRIREAAVRAGLLTAEAAAELPEAEAAKLIFRPRLSTAEEISEISGRGVGLDVVSHTIHRLRGTVDVAFTPGAGARFVLDLPLTLAAVVGILFRLGRDVAAVPAEAVERILRLAPGDLGSAAGRTVAKVGGDAVPFVRLAQLLGRSDGESAPADSGRQPALVMRVGSQRLALAVDDVIGQRVLEVSSLAGLIGGLDHVSGAALIEDGRVTALLNPAELFRRSQQAAAVEQTAVRARILVADDALTTRLAMKNILEVAGYDVVPASDGEEALELLRDSRCHLVVSDVQMPRMDGLELTRRIRADAQLSSTPVVLITSLGSKEDRDAGMEAGADGYVVKRDVERGRLLELVRQLLPERV